MPVVTANFEAPWWLAGPHRQTVWSTVTGRKPELALRRERFELSDGDFVDLDWLLGGQGPIVVVLHGLGGSSDSPYVRGLLKQVQAMGWRGVILNFRGCSGDQRREQNQCMDQDRCNDREGHHESMREPGHGTVPGTGSTGAGAPTSLISMPDSLR